MVAFIPPCNFPDPFLLELGSGERPFSDGRLWYHNDERELPDIEIVWPADVISEFTGINAADELRAAHLLEHFSHLRTRSVLTDWWLALKYGGKITIEVPNLLWQAEALANNQPDPSGRVFSDGEVVELIFGGQTYSGNFHYTGFTHVTLRDSLAKVGFSDITVQDIGQVLIATAFKREVE
jgi:predicted SAM-dependent methyltransferase